MMQVVPALSGNQIADLYKAQGVIAADLLTCEQFERRQSGNQPEGDPDE